MSAHLSRPKIADIIKFRALSFCYFGGFVLFYCYYVMYLTEMMGASKAAVGGIVSVSAVVTMVAQGFWGIVCDRIGSPRKVYILQAIISSVLILLFSLVRNIYGLFALVLLVAFFEAPIAAMFDTWTAQYLESDTRYHYGGVRAYGSIAVALLSLALFVLFKYVNIGLEWVFRGYLITASIQVLLALSIDFSPRAPKRPKLREAVPLLLRNTDYVVLIVALTLVMTAFRSTSIFLSNRILELGGTSSDISLTWVVITGSEVPILLLGGWLRKKFRIETLLMFSFCMFTVRILLMFLANSVLLVHLSNALNGLTFGIYLPIVVTYITRIAPDGFKASAMGLAMAVYSNASVVMGSTLGGYIAEAFSLRATYQVAVFINLAGVAVFGAYLIWKKARGLKEA